MRRHDRSQNDRETTIKSMEKEKKKSAHKLSEQKIS